MPYCPPVMNHSSGVFMVRKACSRAVRPWVSKLLGDKRRVCMCQGQHHTRTIVCWISSRCGEGRFILPAFTRHTKIYFCFSLTLQQSMALLSQSVSVGVFVCGPLGRYIPLAPQKRIPAGTVYDKQYTHILHLHMCACGCIADCVHARSTHKCYIIGDIVSFQPICSN